MEQTKYLLRYVGNEETQTDTIIWRETIKPGQVFETTLYHFKNMIRAYWDKFKETNDAPGEYKTKVMTAAPTPQQPKLSLPELQNIFKIKFGKDVPTNKKNDRDRIYSKLYT